MDFDETRRELATLQGNVYLLQVRAAGGDQILFQMIDGINEAKSAEKGADRVYVNFRDAEGSFSFLRADFVGAGWERAWRRGEEDQSLFRVQVG